MKYLTLIFITSLCFANFISESDAIKKNNGEHGTTVYVNQGTCQLKEGQPCYSLKDVDLNKDKIKLVEVNDYEKPIYAAYTNVTPCVIADKIKVIDLETGLPTFIYKDNDCRKLTPRENVGTFEEPIYEYPLCTDKTYYAMYMENPKGSKLYTAQCTKLLGYQQRLIKAFREDATLKAAYEAKLAEKQAEQDAKEAAKALLKDKKGKIKNLSKEELNEVIEALLLTLGM